MALTVAMADGLDIDSILARYGLVERDLIVVCGLSRSYIAFWRTGFRQPGPKTVIAVEQKLNIPRYELRPDLWPPPPDYRKPRKVQVPRRQRAASPTPKPTSQRGRGRPRKTPKPE
jgi:transcriptional regulator with XRE-family HTH domain